MWHHRIRNPRFLPSTSKREAGVFKILHPGDCFQNLLFCCYGQTNTQGLKITKKWGYSLCTATAAGPSRGSDDHVKWLSRLQLETKNSVPSYYLRAKYFDTQIKFIFLRVDGRIKQRKEYPFSKLSVRRGFISQHYTCKAFCTSACHIVDAINARSPILAGTGYALVNGNFTALTRVPGWTDARESSGVLVIQTSCTMLTWSSRTILGRRNWKETLCKSVKQIQTTSLLDCSRSLFFPQEQRHPVLCLTDRHLGFESGSKGRALYVPHPLSRFDTNQDGRPLCKALDLHDLTTN